MKTSALLNMIIDEVSLVDEGANQHAAIVIAKRRRSGSPGDGPVMKALTSKLRDLLEQFHPDTIAKALDADALDSDAASTAAAFLKEIVMDLETLQKSLETAEGRIAELVAAAEATATVLKAKDAQLAELTDVVAKSKTGTNVADQDAEFLKSLPEGARVAIVKSRKDAADALELVEKMRDEGATAVAIAKAKSFGLGCDADKLGAALVRVGKQRGTAEDIALIESTLAAAGEQVKKGGLFAAVGSDGTKAIDGDPETLLKAKSDEIKKAKPELSDAAAYDLALQANPDLYNAYLAKRRGG